MLVSCARAGALQPGDDQPDAATPVDARADASPPLDASPIDAACATWYRDVDHDLHGDPASATTSCTQPPDTVASNDDCDDANAQRFPGAPETCDGVDNDCNANTLDSCPSQCVAVRRPPPDDAKVYLFCGGSTSWGLARSTCSSAGFNLLEVNSAAENAWVRSQLDARFGSVDAYLGGNDTGAEGSWLWDNGQQFWSGSSSGIPVGGRYANWRSGEPNDDGGEDCAELKPDGLWNDDSCSGSERFVCSR